MKITKFVQGGAARGFAHCICFLVVSLLFLPVAKADLYLSINDSLLPSKVVEYPFVYPFNGKSDTRDDWQMSFPDKDGTNFAVLRGFNEDKSFYNGALENAHYIWHHTGEDWLIEGQSAKSGHKPMYAINNGVVVYSGLHQAGTGYLVIIKHKAPGGQQFNIPSFEKSYVVSNRVNEDYSKIAQTTNTIYSYYLHLSDNNLIEEGAQVDRGQIIGETFANGEGYSYPAHLHFEVWSSIKSDPNDNLNDPNGYDSPGYGQYQFGHNLNKLIDPAQFIDLANSNGIGDSIDSESSQEDSLGDASWDVPFIAQRDYASNMAESACAPTSVVMLLNFYYPNSGIDMPEIYHSGAQTYTFDGPAYAYQNLSFAAGDSGTNALADPSDISYYQANFPDGFYSGVTISKMQDYLKNIWNIETKLLDQNAVYDAIKKGPLLGRVYAHGNTSWGHYLVIRAIDTKGTDDKSDDVVYVNDPYDVWNSAWDNSGNNKAISYQDFFVSGARFGAKWFREAYQLIPSEDFAQRQYTLVVDSGHNLASGNNSIHSLRLFDDHSYSNIYGNDINGNPIWKFYYGLGGDWYYPTQGNQSAVWKPDLQVEGFYRIETRFRADSSSDKKRKIKYSIHNAQGNEILNKEISHYSSSPAWVSKEIAGAIVLEPGDYVQASNIPANANIDAIKFTYLSSSSCSENSSSVVLSSSELNLACGQGGGTDPEDPNGGLVGGDPEPIVEEPEPVLELVTNGITFNTYSLQLKEGQSASFEIYFTYNDGSKVSPTANEVKWIINGQYQEDIDKNIWGYVSKGSGSSYVYHAPTKMPPGVALILGIPVNHDKADYEYYPYILWANTSPSKSLFSVNSHFGGARLGSIIGLSIADVDKNGLDDLFVSNAYTLYQNAIWLNKNGSISTATVPDSFKNQDAGYMVWGDYNSDTFTDAWLFGRSSAAQINNNGNSFGPPVNWNANFNASGFWKTMFDKNNDGKLDAFGAGSYSNRYSPSVADFNNDGFLDVFSQGRFYKNINGNLQVVSGLIENEYDLGQGSAVWGDLDNDGFMDFIYLAHAAHAPSYVYRNINGESFKRIGQLADALHAVIVDVNNDGLLDVVMNHANSYKGFVKLYLNRGLISATNTQGETEEIIHFDDISDLRVLYGDLTHNQVYGLRMAWSDIDNDQDIDIFVADHEYGGSSELLKNNSNDKNALVLKIYGKANIFGTQVRFYEADTDKFLALRQVEAAYGGAQNSQAVHFAVPGTNPNKKYYAEIIYPGSLSDTKFRTGELSLGETYFISYGQELKPVTQMPSKPVITFKSSTSSVVEGSEIRIPFSIHSENGFDENYQINVVSQEKHTRIEKLGQGSYNLVYMPTRDTVIKPWYNRNSGLSKQVTLVVKAANAFGGFNMASQTLTVWDAYQDGDFEHYNGVLKKLYSGTNIHDLEVDSKSNIYTADNYGIVKVDANGLSKQVYNGYVKHLTIDQNDQVYIVAQQCTSYGRYQRCGADQLRQLTLENDVLVEKQTYNLPSTFSYINDIVVNDDGSAFYTIVSGRSIYVYYPSSNYSYETYNSRHYSSYMNSLTIDKDGRLWVSDSTYGYVHQVRGSYQDRYKISRPNAIAAKNGEIYFLSNSAAMYRYRGYNQQAERIAGVGTYDYRYPYNINDGSAAMTSRLRIDKVAVSSDGTLYFINRENLVKLDNTR